jgi:outer membrane lipoprotein-sorting protein
MRERRYGTRTLIGAGVSFMQKRKPALMSFALCVVSLPLLSSCQSKNDRTLTESASTEWAISSTPPFQTREPERYQAVRTITVFTADGKTMETKTLIARDGEKRREESETRSKKVVYLDLPGGKFILLPDEKLYADLQNEKDTGTTPTDQQLLETSPERLMHTDPIQTSYQRVGTDTVDGRNAVKYRIVVNTSTSGTVSQSETLMWIDERLGMPVRSETTSSSGTRTTMELSELGTEVDKHLFEVPGDYQKIPYRDFRVRLKKDD